MTEKQLAKLMKVSRVRLKQLRNGFSTTNKRGVVYKYDAILNDTDYRIQINNNKTEIYYFESGIKKIKNYFSK